MNRYRGPPMTLANMRAQGVRSLWVVCEAGSWWPRWASWLAAHSDGAVAPPPFGAAAAGLISLCDAPGTYVVAQ